MNKDKFLNTYINNITMDETVQNIEQMIQNGQKAYVTPINVDVVMKMEKDEKLKESERVLALKALYEVVETEFINEQGKIYEKYLVKNTTEEERKNYIRMPNRIITPKEEWNPFDDYIEGKCEVTVGLQEIEERLEKELNALQPGE